MCLIRAEPLQLLGLDADTSSKSNLPCCSSKESDTVRVQGFVDGSSPRLCAGNGDTIGGLRRLLSSLETSVAEIFDDCGLHRELDPIERDEPDDVLQDQMSVTCRINRGRNRTYPNPDDTNPSTTNSPDVGEAPVSIGSDDT